MYLEWRCRGSYGKFGFSNIASYVSLPVVIYTLPETNIAMENPPFWWYLPGKMVMFMGYVSFREGNQQFQWTIMFLMVGLTSRVYTWRIIPVSNYS